MVLRGWGRAAGGRSVATLLTSLASDASLPTQQKVMSNTPAGLPSSIQSVKA
jgi:hypothetical protein